MTIETYTGPMFCEKTGRMIREIMVKEHGGWVQGEDFEVFNHATDTRYGDGVISTHDGDQVPSYMAKDSFDLFGGSSSSSSNAPTGTTTTKSDPFMDDSEDLFDRLLHRL